jgi:nicotinate-nucleotide--dimethylbenzimidazole phosphoribosyltransferase
MTSIDLGHHGDSEIQPGLVDFAVNVAVPRPPAWLRRTLESALGDVARYPNLDAAVDALARLHECPAASVLVTNGAAQAFSLIARARPWRKPLVVHPQFTEPESALRACGHTVTRLILEPGNGSQGRSFALDPARVPPDADLVVVGNPTNPTSRLHPRESILALVRPGRLVVVDEAFMDVAPGRGESVLQDAIRCDGLVVIRSLTKTFGLAGIRVGYLVGNSDVIAECALTQPHWSVNSLAIAAAVACAGAQGQEHTRAVRHDLERWVPHLVARLSAAGLDVVDEPAGPFVLVHHRHAARLRDGMRARGFALRRGDTFPGLGPTWLRIAARETAVTDALFAALTQELAVINQGSHDTAAVPRSDPSRHFRPEREDAPRSRPPMMRAFGDRRLSEGVTMSLLTKTIAAIVPASAVAMAAAQERQSMLTKPPGSLGALEVLGTRLCGMYGECPPPLPEPVAVAVFAGDHGVHAQAVSPWPQEVTTQMVGNFLAGSAVINAFGRQVGAEVVVVDIGVGGEVPAAPGLIARKVAAGTADMSKGPAMTPDQVQAAVEVGIDVARDLVAQGNRLLVTGDMGIANTTASAALISVFTGSDVVQVTGRGTGIDDLMLAHKVSVIESAIKVNAASLQDPVAALACVGGFEHAGMVGFLLEAAALHTPVILDGVIACSAALVAKAISPDAADYWVAGHRSVEPGASVALAHLGLEPLVDLGIRLGEGSGAALAVPLVQASARILREVATFDSAGVTNNQ